MSISKMNWSTWIPWVNTGEEPKLRPHLPDVLDPRWPMPAQSVVRVWQDDDDHIVDIELRLDTDDRPIVTGIAIRRGAPVSAIRRREGQAVPEWPEDMEPLGVRPRDVKRLPLSEAVKAAVAWVESTKEEPGSVERERKVAKARRIAFRPPRGRPVKGKADSFYESLAKVHLQLVSESVPAPVKVLAGKMGEDPAKVHVWLHRARQRGFRTG